MRSWYWCTGGVIAPFSLRLTCPRRLLLLSLADDPVYSDVEVQWVAEPDLGREGVVVLAIRRADSTTDVHIDERLRLPRSDYDVAGGVASFQQVPMRPSQFDVDDAGVDLDVGTNLADGRMLRIRIRERLSGPRWSVDMLAPAGVSMTRPAFFPFFWMGEIGFLRWRGATVEVSIDGERRRVVRLGMPWRLTRYATAPMTALWNATAEGPVAVDDQPELAVLRVERDGHSLAIEHTPPVPDVAGLEPGTTSTGRVTACVDGRPQFGGSWSVARGHDTATIGIDIDQPWQPGAQPRLAAAVFALLRVFRTWPTTYRWRAVVDLSSPPPTISSAWTRTS